LGARVKIEVSLEEYVMGVAMLMPEVVATDATKLRVPPSTRDEALAGLRVILPGKIGGPALVPPPQPVMLQIEKIATAKRKTFESDLRMHPSFTIIFKSVPEDL
jgi:hypothetical protein